MHQQDIVDINMLQQTARDCNRLQKIERTDTIPSMINMATDCIRLHQTATDCNKLNAPTRYHRYQYVATDLHQTAPQCNRLKHSLQQTLHLEEALGVRDATLANTLQHTATLANTLQHSPTHRSARQHTSTHRNTRQHTSTHFNTRQHT